MTEADDWTMWEMQFRAHYLWPDYAYPDRHLLRECKVREHYRSHP